MNTATSVDNVRRELAHRISGGIEVTLYWNTDDDSISIEVWQPATEETLTVTVARKQALDAFYHPFAHLHAASSDVVPASAGIQSTNPACCADLER